MFKAIIFDYNGVLVDDLRFHEEAYLLAAKETGFPLAIETIQRHISTTAGQKRKLFFGDISDETWNRIFELKTKKYFDLIEGEESPLSRDRGRSELPQQAISSGPRIEYFQRNTMRRFFPNTLPVSFKTRSLAMRCTIQTFSGTSAGDDETIGRRFRSMLLCGGFGVRRPDGQKAGIKIFSVATGDNTKEELTTAGADWVLDRLGELKNRTHTPWQPLKQ